MVPHSPPAKPDDVFDRDWEWEKLSQFASDEDDGATLGIVAGRRRQGKSYLLEELCALTGGFYFMATEATATESLRQLGHALGEHVGSPAPMSFVGWEEAVDALLAVGRDQPTLVVIDEFSYLCRSSPELPSVVQRAYGARRRQGSKTRMILCGSAVSFMGALLSATAPLRGRAGLDLTLQTFDHRTAAAYWGIDDWRLALRVHAIVGGTPAYRREYVRDDVPTGLTDFDDWVVRTVLDPACPLFTEARYLLAEEPDMRDTSLYHSVLAAVANGHTTRAAIASYVGRKADTLTHPFTVLEDARLLNREDDLFRRNRSSYHIAEPLLTFYHAVMRPDWGRLQRPGRGAEVWSAARDRFRSAVFGPHFEELCREWVAAFASPDTVGGPPAKVGTGVAHDPDARTGYEVDVVVRDVDDNLLALGEAKAGVEMTSRHLDRLRSIRSLLGRRHGVNVSGTRLVCFSGAGFSEQLRRAAQADEVVLVDLDRLYTGD